MESREEVELAAAQWIGRRDTGPWTSADAASLEQWLAASVSRRAAYYRLNGAWQEAGRLRGLAAGALPLITDVVQSELATAHDAVPHGSASLDLPARPDQPVQPGQPSHQGRRARPVLRFALAAAALVAVVFGVTVESSRWQGDRYSTVIGGMQSVPLPDGSHVTLNTDSKLRVLLDKHERLVELIHGEAYFEVAKDPSRPFIVKAGDKRVVAVGTQFSVLREGEEVRVVVSEGVVRLESESPLRSLVALDTRPGVSEGSRSPAIPAQLASNSRDSASVLYLSAGAVARAEDDDVLVQEKVSSEIDQKLSWRNGMLVFRDMRLVDAVAEFNRYNARKIVIEDPSIDDIEVGGIFRSNNIEPFAHLIAEGFPVHETVERDRIVLTAASRP